MQIFLFVFLIVPPSTSSMKQSGIASYIVIHNISIDDCTWIVYILWPALPTCTSKQTGLSSWYSQNIRERDLLILSILYQLYHSSMIDKNY